MAQGAKKAKNPKGGAANKRKQAAMKRKGFSGSRKGAPKKNKKKTKTDKKITAAIGQNIEKIMAARIAHEGQSLKLIARPDAAEIEGIIKGSKRGPSHGRKAGVDVAKSRAHQQKRSSKRDHAESMLAEAARVEKQKELKKTSTRDD